ncbi:MAG TPA: amino acid permease [Steroidobacteraceae bacterium]|jgi:L-asparagine transporter-like permease
MSLELSRSLRPRHVAMISIGGIIGAGLFVGSSVAIVATGPAIVLSYLLTGTLILLVMRMLGEMAVALPNVRAFTEFARVGLGSWAGFVAGWLYWYFWIVTVAVEAIAGATILHSWIALPTWELGLGLMAVMTAVNLMSARSYGEFEFWFSSIKVSAIIIFIALSAAYAFGLTSPHGPAFSNLTAHGGFMPKGVLTVLAGAVTVFFALTGAEITTIAAAESTEPSRAVAKMTTSVIVRILTFYVFSVLLIVCVVPWDQVISGQSPFTLALTTMHYSWASGAMSLIILTAVLSCLNSAFYVCSRVLFLLAEHNDAPQWLVQLNSRRVPTRSVMMGSFAGVVGVMAATLAPETVFAFLVDASGALMVFVYIMVAVAQVRLRRERERAGIAAPALQMWLFPWASYAAIGGMVAILLAMALTPGQSRDLCVSLVALVVAVFAYLVVRARREASRRPQLARPPG